MVLAFSTSSPLASLALFGGDGLLLWSDRREAPRSAGEACLSMLEQCLSQTRLSLAEIDVFAADLGPGSFTGVRVGVVLAKTLAWANGSLCAGADCFDLISWDAAVAVPSKKSEFFVRAPGQVAFRAAEAPRDAVGYGFGREDRFPDASLFPAGRSQAFVAPEQLVPWYLIEPSISTPRQPFARQAR